MQLEDRDVPASFYVDLSATAANPVFEQGRPDQFTGTFGVNGVQRRRRRGDHGLEHNHRREHDFPGELADQRYNQHLHHPLARVILRWRLPTASLLSARGRARAFFQTDNVNNQSGDVLSVTGANVVVNFDKVGFFGGALSYDTSGNVNPASSDTGVFVNYGPGTQGTIDHATFQGIFASGFLGFAVGATGAGTQVTVQNSAFSDIGHAGVTASAGASVNLFSDTYTGRGAGPSVEYFAQIVNGGSAVISGNTVTGIQGVASGGVTSAAVLVSAQFLAVPRHRLPDFRRSNSFNGDISGVIIGSSWSRHQFRRRPLQQSLSATSPALASTCKPASAQS